MFTGVVELVVPNILYDSSEKSNELDALDIERTESVIEEMADCPDNVQERDQSIIVDWW